MSPDETDSPPEAEKTPDEPAQADPGIAAVRKYLLYSLSLPERALRTSSAVVAGALRESSSLLTPKAFQDSKTYQVLVSQGLDFLAHDVGGVARPKTDDAAPPIENFVARKAVGNFIELAGLATLHLSPIVLLAVVSDVAYGSTAYLKELGAELKSQGIIAPESTIDKVDDLLSAVAHASGVGASAFNTPPLSVDGLRQTIDDARTAVAAIDPTQVLPKGEIERLWGEMREISNKEGVNVLEVSSAMTLHALDKIAKVGQGALSSVRVAGKLFDRHVLDHYSRALGEIRDEGLYRVVAKASAPYIDAVWRNFSSERETITEEALSGRLIARVCRAIKNWRKRG